MTPRERDDAFAEIKKWILSDAYDPAKIPLMFTGLNSAADYKEFYKFILKEAKLWGSKDRKKVKDITSFTDKRAKELEKQQGSQKTENSAQEEPRQKKKIFTLEMGKIPASGKSDDLPEEPKPVEAAAKDEAEETVTRDAAAEDETKKDEVTPVKPVFRDYEEPETDHLPVVVAHLKQAFRERDIAVRATTENQNDYPYEYNLYQANVAPTPDTEPTGSLRVEAPNKVVLASDDVMHFVATMKGIKESGGTEIELSLRGDDEQSKKEFAANAIIAGMLTGIEVSGSPYSLDELKTVNHMIEQVIKLKEKQNAVRQAIDNLSANETKSNEQALENALSSSYADYQRFSTAYVPPKEQLRIFKCGIDNIKSAKSWQVAQKVITRLNGSGSRNA